MWIDGFERENEHVSTGFVREGQQAVYKFVADNSDGSIWHLQQLIDGEWMITLERPVHLCRLVAVKMADERWRLGESHDEMATVMIGGEP